MFYILTAIVLICGLIAAAACGFVLHNQEARELLKKTNASFRVSRSSKAT